MTFCKVFIFHDFSRPGFYFFIFHDRGNLVWLVSSVTSHVTRVLDFPSYHETLSQCRLNVGPPSAMLAQLWGNICKLEGSWDFSSSS